MKYRKLLSLYIFLLFVVVSVMFALWLYMDRADQADIRDYEEIKEEGILRIMTEYGQGSYYISDDTIEGFQYELSQAIANISGLEVQIQLEMNLSDSFKALDDNRCDVIARNIPVDIESKENYAFTDPIVMNKQVLFQRTAEANNGTEPIRNQLELAGQTIHVPKNSPAILRLEHLASEMGDSIHIVEDLMYSSEQLAIMVAKGYIDYAVGDQQSAAMYKKELPELDIDTDISFTQLQAWAVRKDAVALKDSLNSWLIKIRKNGMYNKIYQRYYKNRE